MRVCLRNFRNYTECDVSFPAPVTLVVGRNAMGKTSLLEALYFLCTGESHRGTSAVELIRHTAEGFAVTGYLRCDGIQETIRRLDAVKPRQGAFRLKTDGVLQQRRSDWIGQFNVVVFSPESLELVKGAPSARRRWLDLLLSQLNRQYIVELQRYRHVLQHRNALLKRLALGEAKVEELTVWDGLLVKYGSALAAARYVALARLSVVAEATHLALTGGIERLVLCYIPNVLAHQKNDKNQSFSDNTLVGEAQPMHESIEILEKRFRKALLTERSAEIRRGITLVGPHRDDVTLALETYHGNQGPLRETARIYASQGQHRTIALALKLAELEFIREKTGTAPLFLLDDVLSELDVKRRAYLLTYLENVAAQTVITATDSDAIAGQLSGVHLLRVEEGVIIEETARDRS